MLARARPRDEAASRGAPERGDQPGDRGEGGQDGFEVIVCSQLPVDDALGMLEESLPLGQMQAMEGARVDVVL